MPSYISSIKKWFKSGYEGRHLELILIEIARLRPEVMARYLGGVLKINVKEFAEVEYAVEVPFVGEKSQRRADIGIFQSGAAEPFILIEIKYHDKPLPKTVARAAQLPDYYRWKTGKRRGKRHVLVLSRELYDDEGIEVRRWDHLARTLRPDAAKSDLIRVLVDYLEEEGIVMQKVNSKSLQRYYTRLVCDSKRVGRASDNVEGPAEFAKILKNLQMLSGAFTPHFKKAWKDAGDQTDAVSSRAKVATIDFRVQNFLHQDKATYVEDGGELHNSAKNGGTIDVFASHSLGHNSEWIRIDYGMDFSVPGNSNEGKHQVRLYAMARGKQFEDIVHSRKVGYSIVTDKAESFVGRTEGYLQELLVLAIGELLDDKRALAGRQQTALKMLQKSLIQGKAVRIADSV